MNDKMIKITENCAVCNKKFIRHLNEKYVSKTGKAKNGNICAACRQKKWHNNFQGRNINELRAEADKKAPTCKIFTQEEIDAVKHLYTPPKSKPKKRYIRAKS